MANIKLTTHELHESCIKPKENFPLYESHKAAEGVGWGLFTPLIDVGVMILWMVKIENSVRSFMVSKEMILLRPVHVGHVPMEERWSESVSHGPLNYLEITNILPSGDNFFFFVFLGLG